MYIVPAVYFTSPAQLGPVCTFETLGKVLLVGLCGLTHYTRYWGLWPKLFLGLCQIMGGQDLWSTLNINTVKNLVLIKECNGNITKFCTSTPVHQLLNLIAQLAHL